ncbi:E set domain-containing protein, partial [Macrolepiota fuliginosa MF-IS2]
MQQVARNSSPRKPHLSLCGPPLSRHGTLLTANATPARAAAELKSILGNRNARLKSKAALVRVDSGSAVFHRHVTLEQAKPRARVEVDIFPQTNVCVQGGYLRGHIKIYIRGATRKEGPVFIAGGKIRVIGFETLGDKSRSSFYQCSAMLSSVTPSLDGLCAVGCDEEGFSRAIEGEHTFPFALYLSLSAENGQARGSFKGQLGISLNYIAMVSLKIMDESGRRSIAHFYRSCEIWPRLDPTTILSPALRPLQATMSAAPSKDPDSGRIKLTASLHRLHWVAGQLCQVRIIVANYTSKTLKELTLSLHRTTTLFLYDTGDKVDLDADTLRPSVSTKQIAESTLEVGHSGVRGYASAKGWWLGVCPGQISEFEHSILIPVDALTVPRGQLFEVEYSLCVAINSGTRLASNVQVMLPVKIVSFLSIDPPPAQPTGSQIQTPHLSRAPYSGRGTNLIVAPITPGDFPLSDLNSSLDESGGTIDKDSVGVGEDPTAIDGSFENYPRDQCGHALQCSDCDEVELGNLSLADDTDEVVQHAITSAPTDLVYAGFSDLYYASREQDS